LLVAQPVRSGCGWQRWLGTACFAGKKEETMATTTKAQHTPGPWNYGKAANSKYYVFGGDGLPVIVPNASATNRPKPEMEANAQLIAAAPELLSALKQFKKLRGIPGKETTPEWHLAFKNTWAEMEAAIAKAEGQ
jgi:hypothetical protein